MTKLLFILLCISISIFFALYKFSLEKRFIIATVCFLVPVSILIILLYNAKDAPPEGSIIITDDMPIQHEESK